MTTAPMSTGGGWANATIPRGRAFLSPGQDSEGGLHPPARSLGDGHPSGRAVWNPPGKPRRVASKSRRHRLPLGDGQSRADG
jgi:hypothetical protein